MEPEIMCQTLIRKYKQNLFLSAESCNWLALHLDENNDCCNSNDDSLTSLQFLRMAGSLGHEIAQVSLGIILKKVDENESMEWFAKAAELSNAQAQYELGKHFIRKNLKVGLHWINKAAGNGDQLAIEYLKKGTYC